MHFCWIFFFNTLPKTMSHANLTDESICNWMQILIMLKPTGWNVPFSSTPNTVLCNWTSGRDEVSFNESSHWPTHLPISFPNITQILAFLKKKKKVYLILKPAVNGHRRNYNI